MKKCKLSETSLCLKVQFSTCEWETYVLAQFNHSVRAVLRFWLLISTLLERERCKMEGNVIIYAVAL